MPPTAGDPYVTLFGPFSLQYATYSLSVFTGMLLCTMMALATSPTSATGTKLLAVSYGICL